MAKDAYHDVVKAALIKDGWTITDDPLTIDLRFTNIYIDLAAEQVIAAAKGKTLIAVEVKNFLGASDISEFHMAVGQFINYRSALRQKQPQRILYLAVPVDAYNDFFQVPIRPGNHRRKQYQAHCLQPTSGGARRMADLAAYRQLIQTILTQRAQRRSLHDPVKPYLIFDTERDHYLLVNSGWQGSSQRLYGTVSHIRILEAKIYIEYEGFEDAIADELVQLGVPRSDIVLGYRSPASRQFTQFGTLPHLL